MRPVEKYYLVSDTGVEKWTSEDALAAVLAYLVYCGYLVISGNTIKTTECGKKGLDSEAAAIYGIIRPYERTVIKAIDNDDVIGVAAAIRTLDLMPFFVNKGFYDVIESRGLLRRRREYSGTKKLERTLAEIRGERDEARNFNNNLDTDPRKIMETYAFPGLIRPDVVNTSNKAAEEDATQLLRREVLADIVRKIFQDSVQMACLMTGTQARNGYVV